MNQLTIIWISAFLGVIAYFLLKARRNKQTADATGVEFSFSNALMADIFDIIVAAIFVFLYLANGGKGMDIPGVTADFSTPIGAFMSGLGISYVGVNYVLGLIPGLGDGGRKKVKSKIDDKQAATHARN